MAFPMCVECSPCAGLTGPQMAGNFLPEDAQEVEGDYKARVGAGPQMAGNSLPEDAQEVGEYEALPSPATHAILTVLKAGETLYDCVSCIYCV